MADNPRPHEEPENGTGDSDTTYVPTTPQVNRGREQGLGVGQKEIDRQRDPTRIPSAEQYGDKQ